ncbi:hypothetical protein I5Q34_23685 [Streptomyces sp. AV19]|uniref:DUF6397 family protein n=1 Tax=Streptomyces sp. AV19 TaxID=2793068 RepID=UPI0018FE64C6|nr:DUF6397 family protein [Streptomyces sp. AV19]MBH1937232.1 hypothetical protein [Streptomyces sp. AV19]MDG4536708.1 DUF6397 family protein [Streptomyces sp. AV19]
MAERCVPVLRAARELGLKPGEFELAVQLGEVRTVASGPGGVRRVPAGEIERHGAGGGGALRARIRTVGTARGAELAGVPPERFTRLARCGLLTPVRFHLNRYRAVVWHYLATDVEEFAERRPDLLRGRLPAALRARAAAGDDERAANWRRLRVGQLTDRADGPWQRAAATAAVLSSAQLADAVPDLAERAWLSALRPALTELRPATPAGRALVETLVLTESAEEAAGYREELVGLVGRARAEEPAPGAGVGAGAGGPSGPVGGRRGAGAPGVVTGVGLLRGGVRRARRVLGRVRALDRVCRRVRPGHRGVRTGA